MEQGFKSSLQFGTPVPERPVAASVFERFLGISGAPASNPLRRAAEACVRPVALVGLFTFFVNLLLFVSPIYMMQVYDRVLNSHSLETLFFLTAIAMFLLAGLAVFEHIRGQILINLGEWIDAYLSRSLFEQMISASVGANTQQGERLRDLAVLRTFMGSSALTAILDAFWTPMFIVASFLLHPMLGAVALASAICLFILAWLDEVTTRVPLERADAAARQSSAHAAAAASNAELIESMGMVEAVGARWFARHRETLIHSRDAGLRSRKIMALSRFFRLAVYIAVLGVGGWLAVERQITGGVMVAASILVSRALAPVEQAISVWRQLITVRLAIHRLNAHFMTDQPIQSSLTLPVPTGRLTAEGLGYAPAHSDKPILRDVNFDIAPGDCVAVVGPSGSGKTTLARLLVGAYRPTAGSVRLDSADVQQWRRSDFGRHVGYVPQSVQLLPGTIRDNIARMRDAVEVADEEIIAAAKRAGIHEMILRLPKGYDTAIGENGLMLSGGQKQRIALALALFGMPKVLVLDEPNSNLDADGEAALLRALVTLRESGTTVMLITHKLNLINAAEKILVMRDGAVEMLGPRAAVLQRLGAVGQPVAVTGFKASVAGE